MSLKVPSRNIGPWGRELIDECFSSREQRRDWIKNFKSYYYTGSDSGDQAVYNKCFAHVDRLASYLFSPSDVRFLIEFDEEEPELTHKMGTIASRWINREFHRTNVDMAFSDANNYALVKGCCLIKQIWGHEGVDAWCVHPEFFGVLREDIDDLDRQEAFVHSTYLTKSAFRRMISDRTDAEQSRIMKEIDATAQSAKDQQDYEDDYFHQIVIGSTQPVHTGSATGTGMVGITGIPTPLIDPKVARDLVRIDELWVQDRERQDYTTICIAASEIVIEGDDRHRNLCEIKGEQPFTKVCPNEVNGFFWGMSEIAQIYRLQDYLTQQIADLRRMSALKSDPPRVLIGFSGMTAEKYKALRRRGGFASEENPTSKVETLESDIPEQVFMLLDKTEKWFDDVAGFMPIMQGQGEQGVRAGVHAQTLARNASPRMRDRALRVERQLVEAGDFFLKLYQAKNAQVFNIDPENAFTLAQLPDEGRLTVDSHTSSPAFQEDAERKAFALAKSGAIGPEDLIMLTHPPHEDSLVMRAKARQAAQQAMIAQHPELLTKGKRPSK